jgi:hypothetical protein
MDAQGAEAARPYAAPALDDFPTLVDADNLLGDTFGFKAIPNGVLIASDGRLDAKIAGRFDIRKDETRAVVERWLAAEDLALAASEERGQEWSSEALRLFREAVAAARLGEREQAIRLLKRAYPLEPDNMIIRKQLWAIEHPERFYAGDVDYAWQREQLEAGR